MLHTTMAPHLKKAIKALGPFFFKTNAADFRRTAAVERFGTLSRHDFACPHTTFLQASACNGPHKLNPK